ncbi:hypothetical protein L9F63_015360 [Diploptera punctata]|uniref:Guanine nucleotide-binding protein G(s) subunit alpha n=1 Tax=Diploptera punctata TaxID=6984 RepID=A0AAD8EJK1_DIPPU|nr:hypothetical protein L9F63_015360 [Diploptera punctata]
MGCFGGSDSKNEQQKQVNRELEKKLKEWNKDYKKAIKILLLGTGESGKTTIIKQMKILHISGFSESDRQEKMIEIRQNIHESIYDLVTNMHLLHPPVEFASEESRVSAAYIRKIGPQEPSNYTQEYYSHVATLWKDKGIQLCYYRSNEFHFLDRVAEVRKPTYVPSDQDILFSRKRTTGIQKIEFDMKIPKGYGGGTVQFWMFDVGGQRGERRKWLPIFKLIVTTKFVISMSDFDQTLREENGVNRLRESLILFQDVWNTRFLEEAGVIVFLNKQDVLKEKVKSGKSIAKYFPRYSEYEISGNGMENNNDEYVRTRCFIRDMFLELASYKGERKSSLMPGVDYVLPQHRRECYFHFTIATDTNNIKTVFEDVHTMILISILGEFGLH